MQPSDPMDRLDARAAEAVAELRSGRVHRPRPAFDPNPLQILPLRRAGDDADGRGWRGHNPRRSFAIAAVLILVVGGIAWTQSRDENQDDPPVLAEDRSWDGYAPTWLPDGFVFEGMSKSSYSQGGQSFGADPLDPDLGLRWSLLSGEQVDTDFEQFLDEMDGQPVDVGGRRGFRHSGGLLFWIETGSTGANGERLLLRVELSSAKLSHEALLSVAEEITVAPDQTGFVSSVTLGPGWKVLGSDPPEWEQTLTYSVPGQGIYISVGRGDSSDLGVVRALDPSSELVTTGGHITVVADDLVRLLDGDLLIEVSVPWNGVETLSRAELRRIAMSIEPLDDEDATRMRRGDDRAGSRWPGDAAAALVDEGRSSDGTEWVLRDRDGQPELTVEGGAARTPETSWAGVVSPGEPIEAMMLVQPTPGAWWSGFVADEVATIEVVGDDERSIASASIESHGDRRYWVMTLGDTDGQRMMDGTWSIVAFDAKGAEVDWIVIDATGGIQARRPRGESAEG